MDEPEGLAEAAHTAHQDAGDVPTPCPVCGEALIPQWLDAEAAGPNRMFRLTYTSCGNGCESR